MESDIKIKATLPEMERFFDQNDVCLVKYYKMCANGIFEVIIRHAERNSHLRGTYTIPRLIAELQQSKENR